MAEIDVKCNVCGKSLDADFGGRSGELYVDPCDNCYEQAAESAEKKGYDEGYTEGHNVGMDAASHRYDQEFVNYVKIKDELTR